VSSKAERASVARKVVILYDGTWGPVATEPEAATPGGGKTRVMQGVGPRSVTRMARTIGGKCFRGQRKRKCIEIGLFFANRSTDDTLD